LFHTPSLANFQAKMSLIVICYLSSEGLIQSNLN